MQLEGYGNETFNAKVKILQVHSATTPRFCCLERYSQAIYMLQDSSNNKVILGISVNGIMVAYPSTQTTQVYRLFHFCTFVRLQVTEMLRCVWDKRAIACLADGRTSATS